VHQGRATGLEPVRNRDLAAGAIVDILVGHPEVKVRRCTGTSRAIPPDVPPLFVMVVHSGESSRPR